MGCTFSRVKISVTPSKNTIPLEYLQGVRIRPRLTKSHADYFSDTKIVKEFYSAKLSLHPLIPHQLFGSTSGLASGKECGLHAVGLNHDRLQFIFGHAAAVVRLTRGAECDFYHSK